MSAGDDKPTDKSPPAPPGAPGQPGLRDGVQHDSRGNAIWQWAVDTGKHAIDSTSRLLKRLDVPGLKLEDDDRPDAKPDERGGAKPGAPLLRGPAGSPARTSGYDPYGRRTGTGSPSAPPAAVRQPPGAVAREPATTPQPRKSCWQRLFRRR